MRKKILLVSLHAPYGNSISRDAIDVALAAAVYDQDVGYLFIDDGVFQLLKNQQSQAINQKNIGSTLGALELYGVENIYVHKESLLERGITAEDLIFETFHTVNNKSVTALLNEQDHLMSF